MNRSHSLLEFARDYAAAVAKGDLDAVMATLEPYPVFDLYPIARRFTGTQKVRRYFQYFFQEYHPRIQGYTFRSESVGEQGLAGEFDVKVAMPRSEAPSTHRVFSFIVFGQDRLTGERIYADEKMLRLCIGPLWNSLEPIPAD